MSLECSNCQHPIPDNANYCPHCGQSTASLKRAFFPFLKQSLHELLDVDGRLALTLKTLITKPGLASYEFDQGMRVKYTPALRLYLVVSVIFFLLFATFHHHYTGQVRYSNSVLELYSRAMFVLFPMFAVYVKLFYRNSYLISNIVFSLHIHTAGYLVLMMIGPFEAMESQHMVFLLLQAPPALYFCWYLLMAFKTMYRQSWPVTIIKTIAIYMLYMGTLGITFDVVLSV